MMDSIENRKTTVEWLWSLFNVMKCVAVAEAHKDDFNNVKLYLEYSHDAVAGLNPCTLAEHEANVKLALQSWESLQRPIKLAKGRVLEKVEEVEIKEEVDFDDDDALPQGSAAEAALGVKAAPATPKFTVKALPKVLAKAKPVAMASDVRGVTPAGSALPGKPHHLPRPAVRGKDPPAHDSESADLPEGRAFLDGQMHYVNWNAAWNGHWTSMRITSSMCASCATSSTGRPRATSGTRRC